MSGKFNIREFFDTKRISAFNISKSCNPKMQKTVNRNRVVWAVFLGILVVMSPILIGVLFYGSETTIIFRNNDQIAGIRVGKILSEEEYPTDPIAIYKNGSAVYYAQKDNISAAIVQLTGFSIVNEETIDQLLGDDRLYTEFIISINAIFYEYYNLGDKNISSISTVQSLEVYDVFKDNPVIIVMGNFLDYHTHDVKFKVSAGKYVIPFFTVLFFVEGLTEGIYYRSLSGWGGEPLMGSLSNMEKKEMYTKRGMWEVSIDDIEYNYNDAELYINRDFDQFDVLADISPPIEFTGTIERSFNLLHLFTPVTDYGSTTIY